MKTIIIQGPGFNPEQASNIASQLNGELSLSASHATIHCPLAPNAEKLAQLSQQYEMDINALPEGFDPSQIKLLVTDMDSTLISIECIDEIADMMNIKPQVSEITESAMRGEIDFETSLRRRMALLKGLDESALERVYNERLRLNPGAEAMIKGLHGLGIQVALVSGGFTYFTEKLQQRLNLDDTLANQLIFENGKLTGEIHGGIVGAEAKALFLLNKCKSLGIKPSQTISMGDGANDLLMMKQAGLSIAYHAKPKVQQQAHTAINHCGLEAVLGLLGQDH